jgi:RNA polymerase sigma-70 factor (ECF subfamily)
MTNEPYSGDRRLARRMLAGEEAAFEEFFEGYFPPLYRFATARLGGDEDAAEEAAQAALCKAITKLSTYRGEAGLFTWLCTFCRHEIAAHFRRTPRPGRRVELVEEAPEIRAALESLAGAFDEGPDAALDRRETGRLVQVVLDRLPPRYAAVLEWKYVDQLPVREIAERLGLSPKAAESLLTRSRGAFRDGFTTLVREAAGGTKEEDPLAEGAS